MKKKKFFKVIAHTLLLSLGYQLVFPAYAYALTTGPSQPEVQSFEPVGTTEMVDMFTGDFNYNIPLMDVEGYPINIFYHSGVGIEQEASWVGLGWNINPGEINRSVRGLPDDFKGETIEKTLYIKPEEEIRIGIGANVAAEVFGNDLKLSAGSGLYIAHNNYRGLSSGINYSLGIKTPTASIGIGLGVGTQSGADIDLSASYTPGVVQKSGLGAELGGGIGYNSRSGLKDLNLNMTLRTGPIKTPAGPIALGTHVGTTIPVGVQNYVPVIANRVEQRGFGLQYKIGFAFSGAVGFGYVQGNSSLTQYDANGSLNAYGYLYLQDAEKTGMLDFSREKDGMYNETMKNLPLSALTYDVFTVNAQGAGGMFRPFRNDIGLVHDPHIPLKTDGKQKSVQLEGAGPGIDYGAIGDDFTWSDTKNESGPWPGLSMDFTRNVKGSLYENVFFKQAGELTYNQQQEAPSLFNATPVFLNESLQALIGKNKTTTGYLPNVYEEAGVTVGRILWNNSAIDRSSRATNIAYQTAEQMMSVPEILSSKQIADYGEAATFYEPPIRKYNRYGSGTGGRKELPHHISEFTQTMPDGRRYVYGIPALNNITREVTCAVNEATADLNSGYVDVGGNDKVKNGTGRDNFYSAATTPAYAHAYLLTALLSADYVDVLGDGPTDDDLGTFVKYNYSRKSNDYRWRVPYEAGKAQYNPGFWSDNEDGKGNYIAGSREQWMVRTIETKNYIAEFYTSPRQDAKGVLDAILSRDATGSDYAYPAASGSNLSYKLDEIRLYNKHERYGKKENAIPVKTVIFKYNYTLCKGIPNGTSGSGKLTLEKIFTRYGNSDKNLLSPYVFSYSGENPDYNFAAKDRWGNYKKVVPGIHNYEFPYTDQPDVRTDEDKLLASWNLTGITLPSGGKINVEYESDDYSFVQDRRSMQMLHIAGVGRSAKFAPQAALYAGASDVNQFIYFKRRATENPSLSVKENYFEGQDKLYYSFALDIANIGKYDPVRGYATIEEVGICDNTEYAYVKVRKDPVKQMELHPAAVLGINMGRYYIPHLFYDGYTSKGLFDNLFKLLKTYPELLQTIGGQNPFKEFVRKNKANKLKIANSFIRVHTPGLTKRGGGIRVRKLLLSDNWSALSGGENAAYGKQYDYTVEHPRYGKISSGVASYEPLVGGDENPFRQPIPYAAESGRLIPSIDFFQEEPFGESFFPSPSVGYARVTVRSIHQPYSRSAQALDEYLFYTARDYPIITDYTQKDPGGARATTAFNIDYREAKVRQGYSIRMNDMHGKPKAVNNYVLHTGGDIPAAKKELITGQRYYYHEDPQHNLSNDVRALVRKRGTESTYELKNILLGQDVDVTVDSRYRSSATTVTSTAFNVNVLNFMGAPTAVPTFWINPPQDRTRKFHSLVTTKVIQQYGVLKAVESIDHGAQTLTEYLVYDAESGAPLLTRTNNEFNDYTAHLIHPAYLAYEGMRPAYTNDGYEEIMDSLVVNYDRNGYLYTDNFNRFTPGDELLVKTKTGNFKLWVLGTEADASEDPDPPAPSGAGFSIGMFRERYDCRKFATALILRVFSVATGEQVAYKYLDNDIVGSSMTGHYNALNVILPPGDYRYTAGTPAGALPKREKSGTFTIEGGKNIEIKLADEDACPGTGNIIVKKMKHTPGLNEKDSDYEIIGASGYDNYRGYVVGTKDKGYIPVYHCGVREGVYLVKYMNGTRGPFMQSLFVLKDKTTEITIHEKRGDKPWVTVEVTSSACDAVVSKPPVSSDVVGGTAGDGTAREIDVWTWGSEGSVVKRQRCALLVAPRFKDRFSGTVNTATWPQTKKTYFNVHVKVLRSGRRNNLTQSVQQTSFAAAKEGFEATHMSSLASLFDKTGNLLTASGQTYTDEAEVFYPFGDEMDLDGDYKYALFNPYVLGMKGNFRVNANYLPVAPRIYQQHARKDGSFYCPPGSFLWQINTDHTLPEDACDGPTDLFGMAGGYRLWKEASRIYRYDVFGNALEEVDAIGNVSAAQYGYNRALPVAVAANAWYQTFMFENFEEYSMMVPEKSAALLLKGEQYSAFSTLFSTRAGTRLSMYDQQYVFRNTAPESSPLVLVGNISHTGKYAVFAPAATAHVLGESGWSSAFYFERGKKSLLQLWARKSSGEKIMPGDFSLEYKGSTTPMKVKTGSIDGWYLLEAEVEVEFSYLLGADKDIKLNIPGGVYMDDVRILPVAANMKSFVYDPFSFRLMAQLDENHFATFYEYDQEGLLVRTKKETAKGIMTISESRRANSKIR